ncbi:hypothetical protein LINPERHAP1_LOCUS23126 [Linum perenne]
MDPLFSLSASPHVALSSETPEVPPLQPSLQTLAAARSCEPSCVLQLSASNAPGIWGSGRFRSNSIPKRRLMLSTTTWTRAGDITRLSTESESSAIVIGM